ncbi:MAG: hypothetical protein PUC59_05410 [Firmicutes bacterium]|nr:hypothetical protein [Bacillota bacterium]
MKLYRVKKKRGWLGLTGSVLLFAAAAGGFWYGAVSTGQSEERESLQRTRDALLRAAVNCYAIEGSYPADAGYLEEHYGVIVDHERYAVLYDCIGSNVMPYIEVVRVGDGGNTDEGT